MTRRRALWLALALTLASTAICPGCATDGIDEHEDDWRGRLENFEEPEYGCDDPCRRQPPEWSGGVAPVSWQVADLLVTVDQVRGTFDVEHGPTGTALRGLAPAVEVVEGDQRRLVVLRLNCLPAGGCEEPSRLECTATTALGLEVALTFEVACSDGAPLRVTSRFTNVGAQPVTVRRVFPFHVAEGSTSGAWLGSDPARVRVLQNGSDEFVDYFVNLLPGTTPLTPWQKNALVLGGTSSYSNGSVAAVDLDSSASLVVGFLGPEWAVPLVALAGDLSNPLGAEGRRPLAHVSAELRFPKDTPLPPGAVLPGGTALFHLGAYTPFDALEAYADEVARYHDVHLPAAPQSGWDSWYTPRGTDLDHAYLADNAAALARLFGDWGLSSQQLDWGWQDNWGDWNANQHFPDGLAATASAITAHGLKPELWIAPFSATTVSSVWQQHPDWFTAKDTYGKVLAGADQHPFDLANPAVLEHLESLGRRVADWGFESVKLDFAYYGLLVDREADWQRTPTALYRDAVRRFRAGVGPEPTFINIAMAVQNYGLVDALRVGLDTWPCWEGGTACEHNAGGLGAQGVKPMVRMTARRYWLNGRVWWNHNDQVFVRDLSLDEQRAWYTLAAISGGMISLGEDATTLTEEQTDVYRRILPLTGLTARPLDLFEREFPEVWVQRQADPPGALVAFFNWGANTDLTTLPFTPRAEGPVTHRLDVTNLGVPSSPEYTALEFWSHELQPFVTALEVTVPPRSVRVYRVASRQATTFVGTDRHVLMGPGVVRNPRGVTDVRDGEVLMVGVEADVLPVPGLRQRLWFRPAGSTLHWEGCRAVAEGLSELTETYDAESGLCEVAFTGQDTIWHTLRVESVPK